MTMTELDPHQGEVQGSSERDFGFVFAAVFFAIALWPVIKGVGKPVPWAMGLGFLFFASGLLYPPVLAPLNRLWTRFGLLLHKIVTPLLMGILFFGMVTPIALLMRLTGSHTLPLQFDRAATSYWIAKEDGRSSPDSMKNQF